METYNEVKTEVDHYEDYIVVGVIIILICCIFSIIIKIYDCLCCVPKCIYRCCKSTNYNRLEGT